MVGTFRRQQMCLTNRAMSQETLVHRFNLETTTKFCNIIALAWKIRLPWLHNMVHWSFWGRQGTKNYFLTHILIQERPLSLLLWKSFWCQGALQLMALMETTSGLLQPSIMLDWSSHNQTVMLTRQDGVEQEPWLHPGGQRGEHSQGCWGETLTLHCNVFSASFQHIYGSIEGGKAFCGLRFCFTLRICLPLQERQGVGKEASSGGVALAL